MSDANIRPAILIIDDERDILAVVRELLEADGFAVVSATDGKQALAVLERFRPDVILTDLMMPVMDGLAFISAYQQRRGPRAPIVAMSAFPTYLNKVQALGAVSLLLKPFTIEALLETVGDALAGRRAAAPPPTEPVVEDELQRLQAIARDGLDIASDDPKLQRYVERVARVFDVPICAISVVGEQMHGFQQLFCTTGLLTRNAKTPRDDAFCTHAVVARAALIVQDTAENPLFKDNPVVRNVGIRFYAGVPLLTRHGEPVGTLCLMDSSARSFTYFDLELLSLLSRRVVAELERRHHHAHPDEPLSAYLHLTSMDEELEVLGRSMFVDAMRVLASRSAEHRKPFTLIGVHSEPSQLRRLVAELERRLGTALIGRLGRRSLGVLIPDTSRAEAERTVASLHASAELLFAAVPSYPAAVHDALIAVEVPEDEDEAHPWATRIGMIGDHPVDSHHP